MKTPRGSRRSRDAAERRNAAGLAAAQARIEPTLARLDRIDLQIVVVAPPDQVRIDAKRRAQVAAEDAGRGPLLAEACEASRSMAMSAFARGGFNGTWAATETSTSVVGSRDRVAAAEAFEEAMTAAVTEDLVDDRTLRILRSTVNEMIGTTGLPIPGSLAAITTPHRGLTESSVGVAAVVVALLASFMALVVAGAVGAIIVFAISTAVIVGVVRSMRGHRA